MRGLYFLPFALIAGIVWFLLVTETGSAWLASRILPGPKEPVIGRVVSLDGSFKLVRNGDVKRFTAPLSGPQPVADGDRLEVDNDSKLTLVLDSQDEFQVGSLSAVSVQLWNATDKSSPIYLYWNLGEVETLKTGVRGRAYVVKDGKLFFPGQKLNGKPLALTVLKAAPLDMQLADAGEEDAEPDEPETDDDSAENDDLTEPAEGFGKLPESLSSEYINEVILTRQSHLQKCWLSRLSETPDLKGQMVLQFEISRRGKVRELQVTDSDLNDEALNRCVISVIERLQFRPYDGQEITLSYPIRFE